MVSKSRSNKSKGSPRVRRKKGRLCKLVRRALCRLHYTKRTPSEETLYSSQLEGAPSNKPASEETLYSSQLEGAPSKKPTSEETLYSSQLEGAPSNQPALRSKRKDTSEETQGTASKKSRTDSAESPGPSCCFSKQHFKRRAKKVKKKLTLKLQDAKTRWTSNNTTYEYINKSSSETDFYEEYKVTGVAGRGGFSIVYSGVRREDNFPVAIKRVRFGAMLWIKEVVDETYTLTPNEVVLLTILRAVPGCTPVLLDWYELKAEVFMVMERPEPCMDLVSYVNSLQDYINEDEAKTIIRQLGDAAIEMLSLGVFHSDIKPDNILIETGHAELRARFIDFGCGTTFVPGEILNKTKGAKIFASPEFHRESIIDPAWTTAWQLGLTLYSMMHRKRAFRSANTLASSWNPPLRAGLSDNCKDFLRRLMDKNPNTRMSLDNFKDHPWMN